MTGTPPPTPIVVVEDSDTTREMLRQTLAQLPGARVQAFGSVEDALPALDGAPPSLVVTDVVLPGESGLDLCRRLRARFDNLSLPIVIVSSEEGLDAVAAGYEAGADDYILKPLDVKELRRKVDVLLRRTRARQPRSARRYELLERLGGSQMATVYRARRTDDGEVLALKVLPRHASRGAVRRLIREAELLRGLRDLPGVVEVRDVGTDDGCTYYAMPLTPGPTLRQRIAEGPLDRRAAAKVCRGLAETLEGLLEAGVVHGDLKPENVIVAPDGERVTLVDFGLAHRVGETQPERGGTLTYLAPEVVQGQAATPRSDVYALGVVLFETLTGELPFKETGPALAATKVAGGAADLSALLAADTPPGLVAIVEEALAAVGRRTAHPADMAVALLPYAGVRV